MATEMDMDIEMDIDVGLIEDLVAPDVNFIVRLHLYHRLNTTRGKLIQLMQSDQQQAEPILSVPNDTTESNALEPTPQKVHLRGLDNLTTKDIRAFASEYFDSHRPSHVEWIDDSSANLVYDNAEIALEALISFAAVEIADASQIPTLQTVQAKAFPLHPQTNLEVRLAVVGDRKQAGARERSRFYLFNPEHDPAERRKRAGYRGKRTYRDRDDGGYRSQRYDELEQQKRERDSEYDATLYDDDEVAIAQRAAREHKRYDSSSGTESRAQDSRRLRFPRASGKELFPNQEDRGSGRLRDRSASPLRDNEGSRDMTGSRNLERRHSTAAASANRLRAQTIKAQLREARSTKELFPMKASTSHRRSDAFDAADETADLFANKMAVPLMDGSGDVHPRDVRSLASRISTNGSENDSSVFNIKGAAKASSSTSQGFNIKGAARVKELFPATLGDNAGKELFSGRLEGRGQRRQKAEDLFY